MRRTNGMTLMVCGAVLVSAQAHAQASPPAAPAPIPEQMPFDVPYGPTITLDRAKEVAVAANAEAKKHNWKEAIAIVDPNGDIIYLEKMDGAQVASPKIAERKARTAARFRRDTRVFYTAVEAGHTNVLSLDPTIVAALGGLPLIEGGKIIGAVGCSGAAGEQDNVVCKAGADIVK